MTAQGHQPGGPRTLLGYLLVALVLHGGLLGLLLEQQARRRADAEPPARPYRLLSLAPRPNAGRDRAARTPPSPTAKPVPEPLPRGQVVDLAPSPDSRAPERTDYLAERNSRVARESRSRHQSAHQPNVMAEPSQARRIKEPLTPSSGGDNGSGGVATAGPTLGGPSIARKAASDRLKLHLDPMLGRLRNAERRPAQAGQATIARPPGEPDGAVDRGAAGMGPPLTMAALLPPVGVLMQLDGGPSNDHLKDVDVGEGTFLNAREFKYASFFNRLKRGVSEQWRPMAEFQRRDPTGNIYGLNGRTTVVTVVLGTRGELVNVQVAESSGADFLDAEALEAFRRAGPFINPPRGLLDESGQVRFSFGFHIDFQQGFGTAF